jgi:transcriptional regulator with XRE-family HTH domain
VIFSERQSTIWSFDTMNVNVDAEGHAPHPLDVALGQRIRTRRRSLGMSQEKLAAALGLTFQQVQKYERGVNRVSFSKLVLICRALNCRVSDIVGELDADARRDPVDDDDFIDVSDALLVESLAAIRSRRVRRLVLSLIQTLSEGPAAVAALEAADADEIPSAVQ